MAEVFSFADNMVGVRREGEGEGKKARTAHHDALEDLDLEPELVEGGDDVPRPANIFYNSVNCNKFIFCFF